MQSRAAELRPVYTNHFRILLLPLKYLLFGLRGESHFAPSQLQFQDLYVFNTVATTAAATAAALSLTAV